MVTNGGHGPNEKLFTPYLPSMDGSVPVGAGSLWPTSCSKRHTNYVCQLSHIILFWGVFRGRSLKKARQGREGGGYLLKNVSTEITKGP